MNNPFGLGDMSSRPALDPETLEGILAGEQHSASEWLMLYFACVTSDPDEFDFGDAPERIMRNISDQADDGDEEAMMAMVALQNVGADDATPEAIIVGAAMLQAVATLPILRNVIAGSMGYEAAAGPLTLVKMLADHILLDVLDPEGSDDMDGVDSDDIDFDELAAQLGISDLDLDIDGDPNDRQ